MLKYVLYNVSKNRLNYNLTNYYEITKLVSLDLFYVFNLLSSNNFILDTVSPTKVIPADNIKILSKKFINIKQLNYIFSFYNIVYNYQNLELSYSWLWNNYCNALLKTYSGFSTTWAMYNANQITNTNYYTTLYYIFYKKSALRTFFTDYNTFYKWFVPFLYLKDPKNLIYIIKSLVYKTHLKKHKRVFFSSWKIISFIFKVTLKKKILKGCTLYFKGKLAKSGSVRKSKLFFKIGLTSFTNKNLKVNYRLFQLWTFTGSVGACLSIFH